MATFTPEQLTEFVNRVVQELMEEALVRYKMRAPSTQMPGQISFT